MSDEIRRLERKYVFENYPYDSPQNRARIRQLGATFAAANPPPAPTPTPAPAPPTPPPTPPKPARDWTNWLLIGIGALIAYRLITKSKQARPAQSPASPS